MTATDKTAWHAPLKALAERNYDMGYGWQVFTECFTAEDWQEFVEDCESYEDAVAKLERHASAKQERYDEVNSEVF